MKARYFHGLETSSPEAVLTLFVSVKSHFEDFLRWADCPLGLFVALALNYLLLNTSKKDVVLGADPGKRVTRSRTWALISLLLYLFPFNFRWLKSKIFIVTYHNKELKIKIILIKNVGLIKRLIILKRF